MSKKIYIRVDKPIEVGDLVRCVSDMDSHKKGDIRKAEKTGLGLFWIFGTLSHCYRSDWEVVHKLKVGDRVVFNKRITTVTDIKTDSNRFYTTDGPFLYICNSQFELYQPEKHDPKPIWGVDYGKEQSFSITIDRASADALRKTFGIHTAYEVMDNRHRQEFMKAKVAEMIVELMDQEQDDNAPPRVWIYNNKDIFKNIAIISGQGRKRQHTATLSPDDTWDTLTGVYVALCKATGRKLPDWIYGDRR